MNSSMIWTKLYCQFLNWHGKIYFKWCHIFNGHQIDKWTSCSVFIFKAENPIFEFWSTSSVNSFIQTFFFISWMNIQVASSAEFPFFKLKESCALNVPLIHSANYIRGKESAKSNLVSLIVKIKFIGGFKWQTIYNFSKNFQKLKSIFLGDNLKDYLLLLLNTLLGKNWTGENFIYLEFF